MFARISGGKVKSGQWDQYEEAWREVVTKMGKIAGLQARWLLRDSDAGDSGYTVSIWESDEAMREYEEGPLKNALSAIQPFYTGEYTTSRCEIRFSEDFR